ncbi:hypothetical protein ACXC9Q_29690 [Kribbella sp. CWNU-51]
MQKNRWVTRLLPAGLAAVAVAGTMIAAAAFTGNNEPAAASGATPVAAPPAAAPPAALPAKKGPKATKYTFQNTRPAVATLAAGAEVKIGSGVFFTTRGSQWGIIERIPGQPVNEPFGWRKTVGDPNLGDPGTPGIQGVGEVRSSVFKSPKAATVVYTQRTKAWYGKIYRLAGIPGWVESSAQVPGGTDLRHSEDASVFVYDRAGKLIAKFGTAKGDPLAE